MNGVGAHGQLMGRDLLAAALLTVAAAICMIVAWGGGAAIDQAKAPLPGTEISAHDRKN